LTSKRDRKLLTQNFLPIKNKTLGISEDMRLIYNEGIRLVSQSVG